MSSWSTISEEMLYRPYRQAPEDHQSVLVSIERYLLLETAQEYGFEHR